MRAHLAKLRSHEAAEIAEAALVLPVVFIFLLGVIWFGRAFNIYSTITQAAQQGAIAAARSNCVTCGDAPTSDINVVAAISSVLQASSLNDPIPINLSPPTPLSCIDFSVLTCSVYNNVTICRQALLNPPAASGNQTSQCGTIVSF